MAEEDNKSHPRDIEFTGSGKIFKLLSILILSRAGPNYFINKIKYGNLKFKN